MLFRAHAPTSLWVEAFSAAVYTINRLPSSILRGKSPFELLFRSVPNYTIFHPFGCRVFPCLRSYADNKFSARSKPCVFVGYSSRHKGFLCLDPTTSRVFVSRHVQFDEVCFPYANDRASPTLTDIIEFVEPIDPTLSPLSETPGSSPPSHASSPSRAPCGLCPVAEEKQLHAPAAPTSESLRAETPSSTPIDSRPASTRHLMQTRSRSGIFKPRHIADIATTHLFQALQTATVPKGIKSAAKSPHWIAAMDAEMTAIRMKSVYVLVPRPPRVNVMGSKWVFRTKFLTDGSIDRLQSSACSTGFHSASGFRLFSYLQSGCESIHCSYHIISCCYESVASSPTRCQ